MLKLANLRKDKGLTQVELAEMAGTTQSTVNKLEKGQRTLNKKWAEKFAPILGVSPQELLFDASGSIIPVQQIRVEGVSHAGRFEDISLIDDDEYSREVLAAPKDDRFPHAHQYALKVSGDSMNLRYPDGGYVVCAAWQDTGLELKDGHAIHVERIRFASERETTIKIYREIDDKRWLYPDSTNKNHQPFEINGDPDIEIIIKGIILATYAKQVI